MKEGDEAMRLCGKGCKPLCDFCIHYAFNGEPHVGLDGSVALVYVGKGECKHPDHPGRREPEEYCEDFHCMRARDSEVCSPRG